MFPSVSLAKGSGNGYLEYVASFGLVFLLGLSTYPPRCHAPATSVGNAGGRNSALLHGFYLVAPFPLVLSSSLP